MGFKMKGPSTHKGTLRHKLEIQNHQEQLKLNRAMDGTSLPDGRAGSSALQYKGFDIDLSGKSKDSKSGSSLVDYARKKREEKSKISLTPKKEKKKEKTKAELKAEKKTKRKQEREDKRAATKEHRAQMKKMKDFAKKENKKLNEKRKEQKKIDLQKKRTKKQAEAAMKIDKPGTVVSRTAKKIGSKINPWSKENKAKRAKRKAAEAADPEGTLAKKKARRTKIADSIEYLFLDGARPDDRAAARQAAIDKANRKKRKLEKKDNLQDTHTEQNKEKKIFDYKDNKTDKQAAKEYKGRGKQYKGYDKDQYRKEASRQQKIFDKTGKWDYKNAPKY